MKLELFYSVCLSIYFISLTITFIFFTFGIYMEKIIFEKQLKLIVNQVFFNLMLTGKTTNDFLKIKNIEITENESENLKIKKNNDDVIKKVIITMFVLFLIIIFILSFLYFLDRTINVKKCFTNSLLICVSIAIVEISFLSTSVYSFLTIDKNKILKHIHSELRQQ